MEHNPHPDPSHTHEVCVSGMGKSLTERGGFEVRGQNADFPGDEFVADFFQELVGGQHAFG